MSLNTYNKREEEGDGRVKGEGEGERDRQRGGEGMNQVFPGILGFTQRASDWKLLAKLLMAALWRN